MPKFKYQRGDQPLEGYTIEHGLGLGGFGEVYFAKSDAGREVAIKAVQNFAEVELRGIQQCMNLKSPHLVAIYDVRHNHDGDPFVIMEYIQGSSLRDILDESPQGLGPTKGAFLVREIAKGLSYLHESGIVHRDLKPNNVFYENGYVKIGDYSLCKLISSSHHTDHTMTVGTVHYMAPEISEGRYDASVDIYALGIMFHEMLTGEPTYTGNSVGEVLMKHLKAEPDLSGLEEPYRSIIAKAISKNPSERYATAADFVESLYGIDHVRDSIAEFNPQELTIVAERAAKNIEKRAKTTPSGRGGVGGSNAFTEPWRGSGSAPPVAAETIGQRNDDTNKQKPSSAISGLTPRSIDQKALISFGFMAFVAAVLMSILKLTVPSFPPFLGVGLAIGALGCIIASGTRKGFWAVARLVIATVLLVAANTNRGAMSMESAASLAVAVMLFVWPSQLQ